MRAITRPSRTMRLRERCIEIVDHGIGLLRGVSRRRIRGDVRRNFMRDAQANAFARGGQCAAGKP